MKSCWMQLASDLQFDQDYESHTEEDSLEHVFHTCAKIINDIEDLRVQKLETLNKSLMEQMDKLLNLEIPQLKEHFKKFELLDSKYNQVLLKYSHLQHNSPKSKLVNDEVLQTKTEYKEFCNELFAKLNEFKYFKKCKLQQQFVKFIYSSFKFFQSSIDIIQIAAPYFHKPTALKPPIDPMVNSSSYITPGTPSSPKSNTSFLNSLISPLSPPLSKTPTGIQGLDTRRPYHEGYLLILEKGRRPGGGVWKRRYFVIKDGKITYSKDVKSTMTKDPTAQIDLAVSTVKLNQKKVRSNYFEIISPYRVFELQADTAEERDKWINFVQKGIQYELSQPVSNLAINTYAKLASKKRKSLKSKKYEFDKKMNELTRKKTLEFADAEKDRFLSFLRGLDQANQRCADCKKPDPDWTSINFGILICIDCSGIHRHLGAHVSKVRSLTLDNLDKDIKKLLEMIGNKIFNSIYEATLNADPNVQLLDKQQREEFIEHKYLRKSFVKTYVSKPYRLTSSKDIDFLNSVRCGKIFKVLRLLAQGANINYKEEEKGWTALHFATKNKDGVLMSFLIQNGSTMSIQDSSGSTPLHIAAKCCLVESLAILLRYGGDCSIKDKNGKTPLDYAIGTGDGDSVTLLRLANLAKAERKEDGNFNTSFIDALKDIEINYDIRPKYVSKSESDSESLSHFNASFLDSELPNKEKTFVSPKMFSVTADTPKKRKTKSDSPHEKGLLKRYANLVAKASKVEENLEAEVNQLIIDDDINDDNYDKVDTADSHIPNDVIGNVTNETGNTSGNGNVTKPTSKKLRSGSENSTLTSKKIMKNMKSLSNSNLFSQTISTPINTTDENPPKPQRYSARQSPHHFRQYSATPKLSSHNLKTSSKNEVEPDDFIRHKPHDREGLVLEESRVFVDAIDDDLDIESLEMTLTGQDLHPSDKDMGNNEITEPDKGVASRASSYGTPPRSPDPLPNTPDDNETIEVHSLNRPSVRLQRNNRTSNKPLRRKDLSIHKRSPKPHTSQDNLI
uniref:Uncharacterized protein n=1 Tax=Arcella intermedia TaxID=1963864 RepID=A0A6B2KX02_9EUKA